MRSSILIAALMMMAPVSMVAQQKDNTLTAAEKKAGWSLLFDGKDTGQWRAAFATEFPARGWVVRDGELRGEFTNGMESGDGGDIVTKAVYQDFEMSFDWKLGPGGNSGVKYFIEERLPKPKVGSQPGYEYQIIDDADYIYNGVHLPERLKTAAIYDVVPAKKADVTMGVWHRSRIRVKAGHIEHWLDGVEVLDVRRSSPEFLEGVRTSKFKKYPGFATLPQGHLLLQDHGHSVAFRNLKVRKL